MSQKSIFIARISERDLAPFGEQLRRLFPVIYDDMFIDLIKLLDGCPYVSKRLAQPIPSPSQSKGCRSPASRVSGQSPTKFCHATTPM